MLYTCQDTHTLPSDINCSIGRFLSFFNERVQNNSFSITKGIQQSHLLNSPGA